LQHRDVIFQLQVPDSRATTALYYNMGSVERHREHCNIMRKNSRCLLRMLSLAHPKHDPLDIPVHIVAQPLVLDYRATTRVYRNFGRR